MKNTYLIALNTVKEIRRHKILYALVSMVIFIISAGLILGPLSLNEQVRLSINFAFTSCHLGLILISVYFASTLISHEIEKKTVITLFVKPIGRFQFIVGKFFGLVIVLTVSAVFFTLFILTVHWIYGHSVGPLLFIALWGIFLEALILLTVAFFFSNFSSSFSVLVYSVLVFVIGHSANGIIFLLSKTKENPILTVIANIATRALPNFEKLNWRAHALYHDPLIKGELLFSSVYAISWIVLILLATSFLFERKHIA